MWHVHQLAASHLQRLLALLALLLVLQHEP
jgi:hypothetical protein